MIAIKNIFQSRSTILSILLLALLLRILLFIGILLKNPDGIYIYDSYGYWQIAYNIVQHFSFSQSYSFPLEPDYYRTPVYPLFIAFAEGIGPEGFSIIVLQIVISIATCYFTYRIAVELTQNLFIGNVAALLVAIDLPSIVLANLVLTETLFSFLLILSFYFFIKYLKENKNKQLIYSGSFLGLTILCRPIAFFIPFLFAGFVVFKQRKNISALLKQLLLLFGFVLLVISPWLIRNKIVYDHYFLSVIREHNMLNYKGASIYAERYNYSLAKAQSTLRWKTYREFKGDAHKQPYEYGKYIEKEGMKLIFEYPAIFIKHHMIGIANFFLRPARSYIDIQLGHWGKGYDTIPKDYPVFKYLFEHNSRLTVVLVFFQLFILLLAYFFCIAGVLYMKKNHLFGFLLLLVLTILAFANFNMPAVTESRFRVPVWPLITVMSACGIYYVKENFSKKKKTNQP
ncbi:MAG: ArnT family glycosyltransferase [Bacteroidota bacterium]